MTTVLPFMKNKLPGFLKQILKKVRADLMQLHQLHAIIYLPQKETPQVYFINGRASAQFLQIDYTRYFKRRQHFERRVAAMIKYMEETHICRSRAIANYFLMMYAMIAVFAIIAFTKKARDFHR